MPLEDALISSMESLLDC